MSGGPIRPLPGRESVTAALAALAECTTATEEAYASGDTLAQLATLDQVRQHAERAIVAAVEVARAQGEPWSAVGAALAVTKQAAQKRFRPRPAPTSPQEDALPGMP